MLNSILKDYIILLISIVNIFIIKDLSLYLFSQSYFITFCGMNEIKLHIYSADTDTILALPYANEGIHAGFSSPAKTT